MKISIICPGGISNLGERAILLGTIVNIRDRYKTAEVTILGYEEVAGEDPHLNEIFEMHEIKTMPPMITDKGRLARLIRAVLVAVLPRGFMGKAAYEQLLKSDLVIAKGQETLTDAYGTVHFLDSIFEAYVASRISPHVILMGHSIGPINGTAKRLFARYALRRIKAVQVRDRISLAMIKKLKGRDIPDTILARDMAYAAMDYLRPQLKFKFQHVLIVPNAAIAHDPDSKKTYLDNLVNIAKHFVSQNTPVHVGSSVTAEDWNNDYSLCLEIADRVPAVKMMRYKTLLDFTKDIALSSLIISSRLHPIILSDALDKDVLALSSAQKVRGVLEMSKTKHRMVPPFDILKTAPGNLTKLLQP